MNQTWKPDGFHSITPYLVATNASSLIDFYKRVFQAVEISRYNVDGTSAIMHAQLRIGDSILELADGNEAHPPQPTELHLYVPDVNAVYERAVAAGAAIKYDIVTQDYGDRETWFNDPSGNHWYVATHLIGNGYRPEGLHDLTPVLHVQGALDFIQFLQQAFAAEQTALHQSAEGRVLNAIFHIGDSALEFSDAHATFPPMPANLHLYVEDADAVYRTALTAGATSTREPHDAPYGDRASGVLDPFGNTWWIHTHR